jgi:hypothetical protein
MRYRLRTLLILLLLLPPLLAFLWLKYAAWSEAQQAELERQQALAAARQQAAVQAALNALRARTWLTPARGPYVLRPGGEMDYQFPPQRPLRISDEERSALELPSYPPDLREP